MLCTTPWGAIQTAVYVKGTTWYCAVHNLCNHMWLPHINSCSHWFPQISILFWVLSPQSSFQSSFYNISICRVWIICSWCNMPEEGLAGCPSVWEEIQWIKQQEIPTQLWWYYLQDNHPSAEVLSFVKCLDQMVFPYCEDFLALLKKRFYNPKWANHSLNCSTIHYFKRFHSGVLLIVPSTQSESARLPAHQSPSSLLDLIPFPQAPNTLLRPG